MAYQARDRDPLIDSNMQAVIEKRGQELFGFALIAFGTLMAAMIVSYSPDDPSFMAVTDVPVQNYLGRTGASIAAPIFMIVGWSSCVLSLVPVVWGLRFVVHKGSDRMLGRSVFIPIVLALISIYASTLVPSVAWTHSYGLGGLFGDTILSILLHILPINVTVAIKITSLIMGVVIVGATAFILGFSMVELQAFGKFLLVGMILVYGTVARRLGQGTARTMSHAKGVQQHRREANFTAKRGIDDTQSPIIGPADHSTDVEPATKYEDLSFLSGFVKRTEPLITPAITAQSDMPSPEWVDKSLDITNDTMPNDAEIKAKIANVIKSRVEYCPTDSMEAKHSLMADCETASDENQLEASLAWQDPALEPFAHRPEVIAVQEEFDVEPTPVLELKLKDTVPHEDLRVQPLITATDSVSRKVVQYPPRKTVHASTRAEAEAQPALQFDEVSTTADFALPPLALLADSLDLVKHHLSDEALEENARMLESVLDDYGVKGDIVSVRPGPVVTMYELEPAPGLKASRVIGLSDDIARSMSALSARVSTVPGRSVIGIELPNENREKVILREILSSRDFGDGNQQLPLALGKDIAGDPVVANLARMPHLLIAGTTGSGKSVAINTMILSLLYKLTPDECKMIMIDPKMLELSVYDGIPHLLSPVVTDPKKAVVALKWVVGEMEERYRRMSKMGVRNIAGFNSRVDGALGKNEMFSRTVQTGFDEETGEPMFETEEFEPEKMPYIVVVVDEMADLMIVAGKEIEACIQRLAQMARASGIHLIMATQRPSVDVITGTIKANFPTRISFQVTSKIDSRTILGEMGAEQLLGMGDMLYMAGGAKISRCHGPFVSDEEVEEIVRYLKTFGPPEYISTVLEGFDQNKSNDIDIVLGLGNGSEGEDALYDQAVAIVVNDRKCSTSYIQRKLAIGYNKAARLVEQMESEGMVSGANHVGKRDILIPEKH